MIPYIGVFLLIIGCFTLRSRRTLAFLIALQVIIALIFKTVDGIGLLFLGTFTLLCELHWRNPPVCNSVAILRTLALFSFATCFSLHFVPGFHNLHIFNQIILSPLSLPLSMYLNFDKAIVAIILAFSSSFLFKQKPIDKTTLSTTLSVSCLCIVVMMTIALLSGYVRFDPKLPSSLYLWSFNNLFLVCFSEEVIFRGILQNSLMKVTKKWNLPSFIAIGLSSIAFGFLLHFRGGLAYILLSTLAGMFYGYAYQRTGRIEASICVHFILNLAHFLLFTYPRACS